MIKPERSVDGQPRVLIFDIETAPMEVFTFDLRSEYIPPANIIQPSTVLSWAAKWWRSDEPMLYMDTRKRRDARDDKKVIAAIAALLGKADVVVTKYGKKFDSPMVNARVQFHRLGNIAPYKHEDLDQLVRKHFKLPSYKLEYVAKYFGLKNQKRDHRLFPGMELQRACLAGDAAAWKEMEAYNKADVLATEELFDVIAHWGPAINLNIYRGAPNFLCHCGSAKLQRRGYSFTKAGKFRRYSCLACGSWSSESGTGNNLLSHKKRQSLKSPRY